MSIAELEAAALEREHHERMLTICLTMTAGHVDGYGLLVLGTFVSFLSGNTTMTGVRIFWQRFLPQSQFYRLWQEALSQI
jgi:uncharacterized membrane protein YoaK (UPF0700 family)